MEAGVKVFDTVRTELMQNSRDLIQETPEAAAFLDSIIANIETLKLYDGETFAQVNRGIFATDDVDAHGERLSTEDFETYRSGSGSRIVWTGVEHNPLFPPAGRVIAMKAFQSPASGVGFVAGVIGVYGEDSYRAFKDVGIDASTSVDRAAALASLAEFALEAGIAFNPHEIPLATVEQMLAEAPTYVEREPSLQHRKAFATDPILTLMVQGAILLFNPFSKKFLERSGEKAADAAIQLSSWLAKTVFRKFSELTQKKVFFQILTPYKGCHLAFVVPSKDPNLLTDAMASVGDAVLAAIGIVDALSLWEVCTLTFEFDLNTKKWLPLHAATRKGGIIADRAQLIVIKGMQGLSMGGFDKS